ncbi:MAG: hypothetical protein ACYDCO_06885 [Armatimonadota bacterium]
MPESTDSPQVNLLPRNMRHLRWLWLPVALALLLLAWNAWRVPHYRLVGAFKTNDVLLVPAETGFLTREPDTTFVLRDWQDGHRRWAVTVRQPQLTRTVTPGNLGFGSGYSLSHDGHVFAAATVQGNTLHIDTWRDGAAAGHVTVSLQQTPPILFVRALNSGRVFCWYAAVSRRASPRRDTPVYAVENGRMIARGSFPPETLMAPDGSAIASSSAAGFTYAEMQVANGAITLRNQYTASDHLNYADGWGGFVLDDTMFADGVVMAANGAVYGRKGRVRPPVTWRHQGIAPGGRYTLEYAGKETRSYSPVTGKAWSVTVPNINQGGDVTADGRHVLAYLQPRMPDIFDRFTRRAAARLIGGSLSDYLMLYDDAGRRLAVLRPKLHAWWPDAGVVETRWWFPSPDGRSVAMTAVNGTEGRCFLLRY